VSLATLGLAVAGWLTSRAVPPAPADDPELRLRWNPLVETWRMVGYAREVRSVFLSVLGIGWFWFYGALALAQIPGLGHEALGGDEHVVTLLLALFSIGIGLGCLLCERLSGGTIELGLVPLGAGGLTLFALDLAWSASAAAGPPGGLDVGGFATSWRHWRLAADLVLVGAFGGFFIVPLLAFVQHRSDPRRLSRIIAANNIVSAFLMVVAAGAGIGLRTSGFGVPAVFVFAAVVNAVVAAYIFTVIPEFLMRFVVWMLVHTVYRVRHRGLDHLPAVGPAVLVANHVSFVDALVITAASRRPILRFVFRTGRAIPIASRKEDPALLERAYDEVARALEAGELVCIFPEGRITTTGDLSPFRPGIERIVARTPVPVVPLALRGLWGSFFSRMGGPAMRRPFRRFWSRIEVVAGPPIPPEFATAAALQARVAELRGDCR
jgi:1-acyl-sn-glycerol-3-phosphate acyltransferase